MVKKEHQIKSQLSKSMSSSSSYSGRSSSSSASGKKYKGVRMRTWGSWVSEIRAPNQKTRIWLGSYSTAEAAARAYDAALLCLKGSSANLNFPNSSSHYIPDTIMSPKSIQRVAAAAANSFLDNASPTPPSPNPPSLSSLSSASISSPSMSSSPSDQIDYDSVSLMLPSSETHRSIGCDANEPYLNTYTTPYSGEVHEPIMAMSTPWYEYNSFDAFQTSTRYTDLMFDGDSSFSQPMIEDFFEEGDVRLWNFC